MQNPMLWTLVLAVIISSELGACMRGIYHKALHSRCWACKVFENLELRDGDDGCCVADVQAVGYASGWTSRAQIT